MRKLIFAINLTVDGCCNHTNGIPSDELYEYYTAILNEADTFVYGRKTYELMVPYWPDIAKDNSGETKAENNYAHAFEAMSKIVVCSRTLETAEGKNTVIISDNLGEEILKLKQQEGKNILTGGVSIPSQLMALGLVDEFYVLVMPVIAGDGSHLFPGINAPGKHSLKLVGTKVFESGCVAMHYLKS